LHSTRFAAAWFHDEAGQHGFSWHQGGVAEQALRGLRLGDELAAALGKELG